MTAINAKRSLRSLTSARVTFVESIRSGIHELMTRGGFSRERATETLLRELSDSDDIPSDYEIFHLMEHQGLGMDEANQALIVSKAVRRAMKDKGLSAVEAIDDLIQRISLDNLVITTTDSGDETKIHHKHHIGPMATPLRRVHSSSMLSQRKGRNHSQPSTQTLQSKPEAQKLKSSRKRSISEEKATKEVRARADSVAEEVNAKLETRPKGKRDVALGSTQPPAKRPREG